jgi:hypothetical protein
MYVKFSYTNSSIGEDDDDDANGDEKDEDEELIESILKYLYNFLLFREIER